MLGGSCVQQKMMHTKADGLIVNENWYSRIIEGKKGQVLGLEHKTEPVRSAHSQRLRLGCLNM